MKVGDLMTKRVICVRANEPVSTAVEQMWAQDCGALPVLDPNGDRVIGMITDRDACMAAWHLGRPMRDISVGEAGSRVLYFCGPDDSVASAEALMRQKQVRRLPVLDAYGRIAGVLSLADIVRAADRERGSRERDIPADELTATVSAICCPPQNTTSPARAA